MRRYRHRVAVKAKTEIRGSSGGVTYSYTAKPGMEAVPCLVMPITRERLDSEKTPETRQIRVLLSGRRDVEAKDVIEWEGVIYEVMVVQRSVSSRNTLVTATEDRP